MMSVNLSVHNVTDIRLEDRTNDGHTWVKLVLTSTDSAGRVSTVEIVAFPRLKGRTLRVDQPEGEPEDDEPVFMGGSDRLGHTAGERQDIRDAGRGHLLP
jgi:hypothetical protein